MKLYAVLMLPEWLESVLVLFLVTMVVNSLYLILPCFKQQIIVFLIQAILSIENNF